MGKNNQNNHQQGDRRKAEKYNHSSKLVAFTDASVSEQGEATAAIIIMNVKQNLIHSAHVLNLGHGLSSTQAEMAAMVTSLRLAPAGMLDSVVCDNISAVESIKKYLRSGTSKQIRALSPEDLAELDEGIKRQGFIRFEGVSRSDNNIKLADKFSRLARGAEAGTIRSASPQPGIRLFEQKQQLEKDLS